jgi:Cys-rich repeat protein
VPTLPDGGVTSCKTDADCAANAFYRFCHAGQCQADQCSTDGDCPSGQACSCASEQIGNAEHVNRCVTVQCRVDSDCGAGQWCSRTEEDLCSGGPFFACHSSADTCRVDADCCSSAPSCRYQEMLGHWACVPTCTAAG